HPTGRWRRQRDLVHTPALQLRGTPGTLHYWQNGRTDGRHTRRGHAVDEPQAPVSGAGVAEPLCDVLARETLAPVERRHVRAEGARGPPHVSLPDGDRSLG